MAILTASLDDIVFEGRNRAYGAYQLRQDYQGNVAKAGGITLGICGLLFAVWVAWPTAPPRVEVKNPVLAKLIDVDIPTPAVVEKPKQAMPAPRQAAQPAAAAPPAPAIATQVAPDELVPVPPVEQPAVVQTTDGAVGNPTPSTASAPGTGATTEAGPGGSEAEEAANATAKEFVFVEKMPEFAGGQAALLRYLREHLRYPGQALREQAEGRVFMSFVVRADGTIAEATVLKGLGYGLDEEALRVVRQMPAWTPGYQDKHAVAVRFTLPITFKIQ